MPAMFIVQKVTVLKSFWMKGLERCPGSFAGNTPHVWTMNLEV